MADAPAQSALREMRDHLWNARTLTVLVLIGGVLTLVAPFDTARTMAPPSRAAFWVGIVIGTYAIGAATDMSLRGRLSGVGPVPRVVLIACVTGVVTAVPVQIVTSLLFYLPATLPALLLDFAPKFAIGACASLGIQIARTTPPEPVRDTRPPLLDRLPVDKRGALLALSVEDHYVRVRTAKGEEMLLMRLSDAIRETAPTPGLKVHRSHWVALDAVTAARRDGDRAILSLSHGGDIPASRSHIGALKDAGLLPR